MSFRAVRERANLSPRGIAVRLLLTCWLVYGLHFATNTVREIFPALSLGDHLSVDVSEYLGLHPDLFAIPGRGAFINNNPGASFMGALPYALARPLIDRVVERVQASRAATGAVAPDYKSQYQMAREFYNMSFARGLDVKFGLAAGVMQALLMAPLSALNVAVMFYLLLALTKSTRRSLWLALLYAFATPILYRTAQLNQNLLICDFALFAFALLWRPWDPSAQPRPLHYLLAGLFAGWTVVLDYSGIVALGALAVYAAVRWYSSSPRSFLNLARFAIGAAASLAVLLGYQWLAFGNPFLPAQHYMPVTQYSGFGFSGMTLPQLDLLWDTAFGIHFGLFAFAPLLLLALYIPAWLDQRLRLLPRRELLFSLLFTLGLFLFASATQYGRLQFNSGVRYVVPAVPFLFLVAVPVLLRMPRLAGIIVGLAATYWSWCLAMYRDVEQAGGVFDALVQVTTGGVRLPWLTTLQNLGLVSGNGWAILLLALAAGTIWLLWNARLPGLVPAIRSDSLQVE